MKPGSIIERLPNSSFTWTIPPGPTKEVPIGQPVILLEWRYGLKWEKAMFYLAIEGWFEEVRGGQRHEWWYDAAGFAELQPPMDLTFIEAMQQPKEGILLLR